MAKAIGPLLSLQAHGHIKQRLTYSQRKSGSVVRIQKANRYTRTAAQSGNRNAFADAIYFWKLLTTDQKIYWNSLGKKNNLTGFNYFLSQYISVYHGMINYWKFDKLVDGKLLDEMLAHNDITLGAGNSLVAGRARDALYLSHVAGSCALDSNVEPNLLNDSFSVAFFTDFAGGAGYHKLFGFRNGLSLLQDAEFGGTLLSISTTQTITTNFGLGDSNMVHVCYSVEIDHDANTVTATVYRNGIVQLVFRDSFVGYTFNEGTDFFGSGALFNYEGRVDDFRVYNRALSESEVKLLSSL